MTGLFLLLVFVLWGSVCLALAHGVSRSVPRAALQPLVKFLILMGLLPLPLADEIYSRSEFTRLCQDRTGLVVLDPLLAGKTVWFAGVATSPQKIGLLQGLEKRWVYVLAESEAPAFHYSSFHVRGGGLMRFLGISETSAPLLMAHQCDPIDAVELRRRLNITVVDKPHR